MSLKTNNKNKLAHIRNKSIIFLHKNTIFDNKSND